MMGRWLGDHGIKACGRERDGIIAMGLIFLRCDDLAHPPVTGLSLANVLSWAGVPRSRGTLRQKCI